MTPAISNPFTAEEIICAIGIKIAEERAHRLALEALVRSCDTRLTELNDRLENVVLTPGPQGERGEPGEKGLDGERGERGEPGSPGMLPIVKAWIDQVHYQGSVVIHDGGTWQARCDTGRSPPHEDWACLARSGRDGVDGASFKICGTWEENRQYSALNVAIRNGGAFVAKCDNPGPCPGDGWQMMASQGKQGKPGERGPAGPPGGNAP